MAIGKRGSFSDLAQPHLTHSKISSLRNLRRDGVDSSQDIRKIFLCFYSVSVHLCNELLHGNFQRLVDLVFETRVDL